MGRPVPGRRAWGHPQDGWGGRFLDDSRKILSMEFGGAPEAQGLKLKEENRDHTGGISANPARREAEVRSRDSGRGPGLAAGARKPLPRVVAPAGSQSPAGTPAPRSKVGRTRGVSSVLGECRKSSASILFLNRFICWSSVLGEQEKMSFFSCALCSGILGEAWPEYGGHWKLPGVDWQLSSRYRPPAACDFWGLWVFFSPRALSF